MRVSDDVTWMTAAHFGLTLVTLVAPVVARVVSASSSTIILAVLLLIRLVDYLSDSRASCVASASI